MNNIFVFGSNLAGIHGAGSAHAAKLYHGAIYGIGVGLQGRAYAIPTKNGNFDVLPLEQIRLYVNQFLEYAKDNPNKTFNVVAIGCGLAGFNPEEIAPMFKNYTDNVKLPKEFLTLL